MTQLVLPQPSTDYGAKDEQSNHQTSIIVRKEPKAPYFFYRNFSDLSDPDPSKPVTAAGRIPNFPAKMMAILSRPDLADIISWMPHGRSWKVHKPREFEVKVIPSYFEHSKFSSFIRQANGWGFRRMIGKGPDRNSYYHEMFLRGLPHLVKLMKRPTSTSRPQADASTEPNFYRIAEEHPLPESKAETDGFIAEQPSCPPQEETRGQYSKSTSASGSHTRQVAHAEEPPRPTDLINHWHDSYAPTPVESYEMIQPIQYHYDQTTPPPTVPVAPATTMLTEEFTPLDAFQTHAMPVMVARAVSPVQCHIEGPYSSARYAPCPVPLYVPSNEWTETCREPRVMPSDFEDPFAGGLSPHEFW